MSLIYVTPGTEAAVLHNMSEHLKTGGLLLAAFELNPYPWTDLTQERYESLARDCGLTMVDRWSGPWDRDPWRPEDRYLVSLHELR